MKKEILEEIKKEAEDIKKIAKGDFKEIDELEKNSVVMRYLHLLNLKETFEYTCGYNIDECTIEYLVEKYGKGVIQESNNVWYYVFKISAEKCEKYFNYPLNDFDKNCEVLVYMDIEDSERKIIISESEQEEFESTHNIIAGNLSIYDEMDRYYNVRSEFFRSCLKEGNDVAVQKILSKYSKK